MIVRKLLLYCFLVFSLLLPYANFVLAAGKPEYIGINENQEIIWNTTFDKSPLNTYYEDLGYTEDSAENQTDNYFDEREWDEDILAWRIIIKVIKDEDSIEHYDGLIDDKSSVQYVEYKYSLWESKIQNYPYDWEFIDLSKRDRIYESEKIVWADLVIWDLLLNYQSLNSFIVPKDIDWDKIANEINDWLEKEDKDDEFRANSIKINYFFMPKGVGIEISVESDKNAIDDFESISKYNNDGIMYYFEWTYDGDIICKFELATIGGKYLIENWWWILIMSSAIIIGVIFVLIIIIKKRRKS